LEIMVATFSSNIIRKEFALFTVELFISDALKFEICLIIGSNASPVIADKKLSRSTV
jgi:hypothetical protein